MIKKIIIYFIIFWLSFWNDDQAYAIDRVVLTSIPSEYDSVYLIADKKSWMEYDNFIVQVGDRGQEKQYHFPNWYHVKYDPGLFYQDINNDSLKDIVVVLVSGAGSGISTKEIHVLNQIKDWEFKEVPVESINKAVNRLVKMEKDGNLASIDIVKKKYVVDISKFHYLPGTINPKPSVGSIEQYWTKNGILYGSTVVFITPAGSIGVLTIGYFWDGKMYKAKSITFEEEKPLVE
jgi:hypothetical protein